MKMLFVSGGRLTAVMAVLMSMAGCTGLDEPMRASVFEGEKMVAPAGPPSASDTYTSKVGDTLYSVAWKESLDYRALALWNGLSPEAGLKPGQQLRLIPPVVEGEPRPLEDDFGPIGDIHALQQGKTGVRTSPSSQTAQTQSGSGAQTFGVQDHRGAAPIVETGALSNQQLANQSAAKPPAAQPSQKQIAATPDNSKAQLVAKANQLQTSNAMATPPPGALRWQRPTVGSLARSYSSDDVTRKGVHISGREGQAIKAAEAGKVVYSGTGLVGYGNLVIVKHNNNYLSAYGNNRKNLVKEGEMVTAGQQIAEMGRSDKGDPLLHFEIRYQGKPINPASVLAL